MLPFFVYMLRCHDGSFYVGHTDDLEQRFAQHQSGDWPGYTRNRRPVALVFSQELPSRDEAFAAERQIKGWSRAKKEALTRGDWDGIHEIVRTERRRAHPSTADALRASSAQGERQRNTE